MITVPMHFLKLRASLWSVHDVKEILVMSALSGEKHATQQWAHETEVSDGVQKSHLIKLI